MQGILADRLIDNVNASPISNLASFGDEIFSRVIDDVMAAEISCDLSLCIRADGADHGGSEMTRPRAKNMAYAASSRMDQNIVARLHGDPPVILGSEGVGEVQELGPGVTGFSVGERVPGTGARPSLLAIG